MYPESHVTEDSAAVVYAYFSSARKKKGLRSTKIQPQQC